MDNITLNASLFERRAKRITELLGKSALNDVECVAVCVGSASGDAVAPLGVHVHMWLFEYELSDTLLLIRKDRIFIASSQKKIDLLIPLAKEVKDMKGTEVELFLRTRDNTSQVLEKLKEFAEGKKLGTLAGPILGLFSQSVQSVIKELNPIDISMFISAILCQKEDNEIKRMRDVAEYTVSALNKAFVVEMENIINDQALVSSNVLSNKVSETMQNPSKLKNTKFSPDDIEVLIPPSICSGLTNALTFLTDKCDDKNISADIVQCAVTPLCKFYAAPFARTYFINASKQTIDAYNICDDFLTYLMTVLKPGVTLSSVHEKGEEFLRNKASYLLPFTQKNFGYACGLVVFDENLPISASSNVEVKEGMTFVVTFGVKKAVNPDEPNSKPFSFFVADSVVVLSEQSEPLTRCARKFKSVSYEEEDDEESLKAEIKDLDQSTIKETRLREKIDDHEKRISHQAELGRKLHTELRLRASGLTPVAKSKSPEIAQGPAYKSTAQFPRDAQPGQVYIDTNKEVVLCPIYGVLVPFRIETVKNVTTHEKSLRINFNPIHSGAQNEGDELSNFIGSIRELTYVIPNPRTRSHLERVLKEVKKRINLRNSSTTGEEENFVEQERLIVQRGRNPKLIDVNINPSLTGRRCVGTIEAHTNGFRFTSNRGQTIDIIYKNIRFAFYQQAEKEIIVLIHFRLKQPIIVGKKKTLDVQFFTEVAEFSTAIDRRTSAYDDEEIEEEQRMRELKRKLNKEFFLFCEKVSEMVKNFEFDAPFRDLGFSGVPDRANVDLFPTTNCIVSLTEQPFFILPVQDIEIVVFERVSPHLHLRNFDLAIVFKDYSKPVQHISNIPSEYLEQLQEWFDTLDTKYYTFAQPLQWKRIMPQILATGIDQFVADGGWDFLQDAGGDESEDEEAEQESDFKPESEDDDESVFDEVAEDESESEEDYEDESEEGENWSDLEKEAVRADKEKNFDEEERTKIRSLRR